LKRAAWVDPVMIDSSRDSATPKTTFESLNIDTASTVAFSGDDFASRKRLHFWVVSFHVHTKTSHPQQKDVDLLRSIKV
jgi:hypothetical protein